VSIKQSNKRPFKSNLKALFIVCNNIVKQEFLLTILYNIKANRLFRYRILIISVLIFCLYSIPANSQTYYWTGGNGSWGDTLMWSFSSGGSTHPSTPPGITNNVIFDGNSFQNIGDTVFVTDPNNQECFCKSLIWQNSSIAKEPVFKGAHELHIYGSLQLIPFEEENYQYLGLIFFKSDATGNTISSNGNRFRNHIYFRGTGGEWTLLDSLAVDNNVYLHEGTLNTNNYAVDCDRFFSDYQAQRTLIMGNSTFYIRKGWDPCWFVDYSDMMTLDAGTSTIIFTHTMEGKMLAGEGLRYNDVIFQSHYLFGQLEAIADTFNNVSFTDAANGCRIYGNHNVFNTLFVEDYTHIYGHNNMVSDSVFFGQDVEIYEGSNEFNRSFWRRYYLDNTTPTTMSLQADSTTTFRQGITMIGDIDCEFSKIESTESNSNAIIYSDPVISLEFMEIERITATNSIDPNALGIAPDTAYNSLVSNSINWVNPDQYIPIHLDSVLITNVSPCYNNTNGAIQIYASGGMGQIQYSLDNVSWYDAPVFTNLSKGPISIYLQEIRISGQICSTEHVLDTLIGGPDSLTIAGIRTDSTSCFGECSGMIIFDIDGGTAPYQLSLDNGSIWHDGDTLHDLCAGNYPNLLIRDANLCPYDGPDITAQQILQPEETAIIFSTQNLLCHNDSSGSISALATGTYPPFEYSWINTLNPNDTISETHELNNLPAGTYKLITYDRHQCEKTAQQIVVQPDTLNTDFQNTAINCYGEATAIITSTASGGTSPFSHYWSTGQEDLLQNPAQLSNIAAGVYSDSIVDANGCSFTKTNTVVQPPQIEISFDTIGHIDCFGDATGFVKASIIGGTPLDPPLNPYILQWSPGGESGDSIYNKTAGEYILLVTDKKGCARRDTALIQQNSPIEISINLAYPSCAGDSSGWIKAVASGGTPGQLLPYTYEWRKIGSAGIISTEDSISNLPEGSYQIMITDSLGCVRYDTADIIAPPPVTIDFLLGTDNCSGTSGNWIKVLPGGGTPYQSNARAAYDIFWLPPLNSTEDSVYNLNQGTYYCRITDSLGCQSIDSATVAPFNGSLSSKNSRCNGSNDGYIMAHPVGGSTPYTFEWKKEPNPAIISTNDSIYNLSPGTYTLIATDNNNCLYYDTASISQPTALSLIFNSVPTTCYDSTNGLATAIVGGGTSFTDGSYHYLWSNASTEASITAAAGWYTLLATDSLGCSITDSVEIMQPDSINITSLTHTDLSCYHAIDGSISINASGGTGTITYTLSPTAQSNETGLFAPLPSDNYTVLIQDEHLCSKSSPGISIIQPDTLTITNAIAENILCHDANDGKITIAGSGGTSPLGYTLFGPDSLTTNQTGVFENLSAGSYFVVLSDINNCPADTSTLLDIVNPPAINIIWDSIRPLSCHNANDGEISIMAEGGVGALTYTLLPNNTSSDTGYFSALTPGIYTIKISDTNNCELTRNNLEVINPDTIDFSFEIQNISCYNADDGSIIIHANGGTAPYEYSISSGTNWQTDSVFELLQAGSYGILVKDTNMCISHSGNAVSTNITQPDSLTIEFINIEHPTCNGCTDGSVTAEISGGTAPYQHFWSNGGNDSIASGLTEGCYTDSVVDQHGCYTKKEICLSQPPEFSLSIDSGNVRCYGGSNAWILAHLSGGTKTYSYEWRKIPNTAIIGTDSLITGLDSGTYQIKAIDFYGYSIEQNVHISQPDIIQISLLHPDSICPESNEGWIKASVQGGNQPYHYSYHWSSGDTLAGKPDSLFHLSSGTYSLTITDDSLCQAQKESTIFPYPAPTSGFLALPVCFGDSTEFISQSLAFGSSIDSWHWNFEDAAAGDDSISEQQNPHHLFTSSGSYNVAHFIIDERGCISDTSIKTVLVYSLPVSNFTWDTACNGNAVPFTDLSINGNGNVNAWNWQFGDALSSTLQNPSHLYSNYGDYSVTLSIEDNFGCSDSITKDIRVFSNPIANFTALNPCAESQVEFIDESDSVGDPITSWFWDFDDGTYTSLQNPVHVYGGIGNYDVSLTVRNAGGCIDSIADMIEVWPSFWADFTFDTVCLGLSTQFRDTLLSSDIVPESWYWDFGDGSTSTQQHPQHTFSNFGNFSVLHSVTDTNGCIATRTHLVKVFALPDIDFDATTECIGDSTAFTNLSQANADSISSYFWDFGDGSTSNRENPKHLYLNSGNYDVALSITNSNQCSSADTLTISVYPLPVANFIADSVCLGSTSHFTDQSFSNIGTIDSWFWDFGDGFSSASQSPNHTFASDGNHLVQLIVWNNNMCSDTIQKGVIVYAPPLVQFNFDTVCLNEPTSFNDLSSSINGTITEWLWDFGNGNFSSDQNPQYIFTTAGNHSVSLLATDNQGCSAEISKTIQIDTLPIANFSFGENTCLTDSIQFTDESQAFATGILEWNWNFGDGGTSIQQHPKHKYSSSGSYSVRLIIENSNHCRDTLTQVLIMNPMPEADFNADTACLGESTHFIDASSSAAGNLNYWFWDFGDGSTSSLQNPAHIFASDGWHAVQLISGNHYQCTDTIIKNIYVRPIPRPNFSTTDGCLNDSTYFTDLSTSPNGSINSWNWNFGDGNSSVQQNPVHLYTTSGLQSIALEVTDNQGCSADTSINTEVYPLPIADFSTDIQCVNDSTIFNDLSSGNGAQLTTWSWEFGDGGSSNLQNPKHAYLNGGNYTVLLVITNANNCTDSIQQIINVHPLPRAGFENGLSCAGDSTIFTDTSNTTFGTISYWEWNFGDPASGISNVSYSQNPIHRFSTAGIFDVVLIIENTEGCRDTVSKPIEVLAGPQVDFTFNEDCLGDTIFFTDQSQPTAPATLTDWMWNFGDGSGSSQQNPWHLYSQHGTYEVRLRISESSGCSADTSKILHIWPLPVADFTYYSACINEVTHFIDQSTGSGWDITEWLWNFGDPASGAANTSTLQNPGHTFTQNGDYLVSLTVENEQGCFASIQMNIHIVPGPIADFSSDTICQNTAAYFNNLSWSLEDPIVSWYWNFGDGDTSTLQYPYHTYQDYGSHYISLQVETQNGCSDEIIKEVFVTPLPDVDFNWANENCAGGSIQFYDLSSFIAPNQVEERIWDFGDGSTSELENPTHTYSNIGIYTVTLSIRDTSGCYNSLSKNIEVWQGPAASFTSNTTDCDHVYFQDLSSDIAHTITAWYWNFGDAASSNNTSTLQNPSHAYADSGIYFVRLIVENELFCRDTIIQEIHIEKPLAGFSSSGTIFCPDEAIQFTDTSYTAQQTITDWFWTFGDGSTSILQNPIHNYQFAGNYQVKLFIQSASGCSDSCQGIIHVLQSPYADFSTQTALCQGDSSQFNDQSLSLSGQTIIQWQWEFGDGGLSNLQNPEHLYTNTGVYSVNLHITDAAGCSSDTSKTIEILQKPISNFDVQLFDCDSAVFEDLSIAPSSTISSWLWNFGDPASGSANISTEQNPYHLFYNPGTYQIRLITSNIAGCSDTALQTISIEHPTADFSMAASHYCPEIPVQFTDESTGINLIEWFWEFGDGNTSSESNPQYAYSVSGIYQIRLSVTDINGCISQKMQSIEIHGNPISSFISDAPVCLGDSIIFENQSAALGNGSIVSHYWEFGDGQNSNQENPKHLYSIANDYMVSLRVSNENGCFDLAENLVSVQPVPTADFQHNIYGCDSVQFNDLSYAPLFPITYWEWNFDDPASGPDNISTEQNPLHLYSEAGIYDVRLIVSTEAYCSDTIIKTVTIDNRPVAGFIIDQDSVCTGLHLQFTDTSSSSSGSILSWLWSFGDGTTSNQQSPQHAYEEAGSYFVTLTVSNSIGCTDNSIRPVFISPGVFAAFDYSNLLCIDEEVYFYDGSSSIWQGDISEWLWDFGDGTTSTEQNPVHNYSNSGNYQVSLQVTNSFGCIDDSVRNISIHQAPNANFITDTPDCDTTWFSDLSSDSDTTIIGWLWDFGDPASGWQNHSTEQNPLHIYYMPGTYQPQLKITNATGCEAEIVKNIVINRPVADFNTNSPCLGQSTNFTDISWSPGGAIVSWHWDLGDGTSSTIQNPVHTYTAAGTYFVALTVTNNLGCVSQIVKPVYVEYPPIADFQMEPFVCRNETVYFEDQSYTTGGSIAIISWYWDFGDGAFSLEQNPVYAYPIPGNYIVTLMVYDENGCNDIETKAIEISNYPQANFLFDIPNCDTTWFTDISNGMGNNVIYWHWNFDDPASGAFNTSIEENPWHIFSGTGTYNVQLIATTSGGCTDSISKPVFFDAQPDVGFLFDTVCLGNPTHFTDTSTGSNLVLWNWDFGNGHSSTQQNPEFTFAQHGLNPVTLSITNQIQCSNSTTINVLVDTLPEPMFDMSDTTCLLHEVQFTDLSEAHATGITSRLWNFGDGNTSTEENPTHTYTVPGLYFISLSITNTNACSNTLTKPIFVNPDPVANFTFDTVCLGYPTNFMDLSGSQYSFVTYWEWHFGDGSDTLNIIDPPHVYENPGTYTVQLIIADLWGCMDTISKEIIVYPLPEANFIISNDATCQGDTIWFEDQSTPASAPLASWNWYFGHPSSGNNDTSILQNPWHIYDSAATYYTLLMVTDSNGCRDDILKPVEIHPKPFANFTYSSSCITDSVQFTDLSFANYSELASWFWDFGDGQSSDLQNPTHLYTDGLLEYTVNLTVTDTNGCSKNHSETIELMPLPEAAFTYSMNTPCSGEFTEFYDQSSTTIGIIHLWNWDFGDGGSASIPNPVHYYTESGTYAVRLIVGNTGGCYDTVIQDVTINEAPFTDFTYDTVCFGDTTQFIDTIFTSGDIVERKWEFGDGQTQYGKNPRHYFTYADTFNVALSVRDIYGCENSISKQVIVRPSPVIDFNFSVACLGNATEFHGINQGNSSTETEWYWDFGDTTGHSFARDTNYIYRYPGVYLVRLSATDQNGCTATIEKNIGILDIPRANFTWENTYCDDGFVQFYDSTWNPSASIIKWEWQLDSNYFSIWENPDYVYDITDTCYQVKLIATDSKGCSDSITKEVCVAPGFRIDFTYNEACPKDSVLFQAMHFAPGDTVKQWKWRFGQNEPITTDADSIWHSFDDSGPVEIKLWATDAEGCIDSISRIIYIYKSPEVEFIASKSACYDSTYFQDQSIANADEITEWLWDFGDTTSGMFNTSNLQNPRHLYAPNDSTYWVRLKITNSNGCSGTDSILVERLPCFYTDFRIINQSTCERQTQILLDLSYTGSPDISIIRYDWDFGDGDQLTYTEKRDSILHTWLLPGTYPVYMAITALINNELYTDTLWKNIHIHSLPKTVFTSENHCLGDTTHFFDESSISSGSIAYRLWQFGSEDYSNEASPKFYFPEVNNWPVMLKNISDSGCVDSLIKNISINPLPEMSFRASPETACGDSSLIIFVDESEISSGMIIKRTFRFGDGYSTTTSYESLGHTYAIGNYTVYLEDMSMEGCSAEDSIYVNIFTPPEAIIEFQPDSASGLNPEIEFFGNQSIEGEAPIIDYYWNFGDREKIREENPVHTYADTGRYEVLLKVTDENQCTDTDTTMIRIYPELSFYIANAFTPNGNGLNATFGPRGLYFEEKSFEFLIFNRWGNLIFESSSIDDRWDGTYKDKEVPVGLYIWIINLRDNSGTKEVYKGNVMLIR